MTSFDGHVYAFDASGSTSCSGARSVRSPLWTATAGARVTSSPAVANGIVCAGSDDSVLCGFDAAGAVGLGEHAEDLYVHLDTNHRRLDRIVSGDRQRSDLRRLQRRQRVRVRSSVTLARSLRTLAVCTSVGGRAICSSISLAVLIGACSSAHSTGQLRASSNTKAC